MCLPRHTLPSSLTEPKPYPSNLTERQWAMFVSLLPGPFRRSWPINVSRSEIVNAILYVLRTGCAWRSLPHDLASCVLLFLALARNGTWERIHGALHPHVRAQAGRAPTPRAGMLDSQSVKTTEQPSPR